MAGGWTESGHRETSEKGSSPRKLPHPVGAHRVTERQPQTLAWLLCPKQPPPLSLQVSTQGCPSRVSQGAQQQGVNRLGAVCSGWAGQAVLDKGVLHRAGHPAAQSVSLVTGQACVAALATG